jgi:phage terminase large subunit
MKIPKAYEDALKSKARYLILYGGSGAGKSEFMARKVIIRCLQAPEKFLVIRKYGTTLNQSVIATIKAILNDEGIPYKENRSERTIKILDSEIIFTGLDDPEKIKSIKGITSVWVEEASEINRDELIQIDLRLRGDTPSYKQIALTFNPVVGALWIKDFMQSKPAEEIYSRRYTIADNPFIDAEYKKVLHEIDDDNYRRIYLHGEWGFITSAIYTNWTPGTHDGDFDYFGLDFGYNNPTALVGIKETETAIVVKELLYAKGMTQDDLRGWLQKTLPQGSQIFADAAEPARIEDLKRVGYRVIPADKRVTDGILYCKSKRLYLTEVTS